MGTVGNCRLGIGLILTIVTNYLEFKYNNK